MNSASKLTLISCAAFWGLCFSSCSLNEVWDTELYLGQTSCTKNDPCFDGYDCLVNKCVEFESVPKDSTCLGDKLCQPGLVCTRNNSTSGNNGSGYVCKTYCEDFYGDDKNCDSTTYCRPVFDSATNLYKNTNACYAGECSITNAEYDEGKVGKKCSSGNQDCAIFKTGVGACFNSCEYWYTNGIYNDSILASGKACHPIGLQSPIMAEITAGTASEGEPCNILKNPCQAGYVCIKGFGTSDVCHKLCELKDNDDGQSGCMKGKVCNMPVGTGTQPYMFCNNGEGEIL